MDAVERGGGVDRVTPGDEVIDVLGVVHEITTRVHASRDLRATLDAVAEGVRDAVGFDVVAVTLTADDGLMEVVTVVGPQQTREGLLGRRDTEQAVRAFLAAGRAWGGLRFVDHAELPDVPLDVLWSSVQPVLDEPDAWHPDDLLCAVLTTPQGEWLGTLSVDVPRDGRRPSAQQRQLLEVFADHAAIAIMHARLHAELLASREASERAATHDTLTGLGNRALLARHEHLDASEEAPVGVVTVDLDDFKAVNDTSGHEAGDEVLRVLAQRMRGCVREDDVVVRTGGDEFVLVLTGPGTEAAVVDLSERLDRVLREPVVGRTGTHRVGASTGSATATAPTTLTALLRTADEQMYRRKRDHHAAHAAHGADR